jgi:alpha-1,3(6)-mannosylglycoprotein beta-1,6-N-acetyl-glucosaminyltransferase
MWENVTRILDIVNTITPVHGTVNADTKYTIPSYVVNHGVLNGEAFHSLLRQVKVSVCTLCMTSVQIFLGLGFPYEGPAPMEAIANGCVYINPIFHQPKGRLTETFFNEKPTLRELTSQTPYLADFVGPPYVLSVDIHNETELRKAVHTALNTDVCVSGKHSNLMNALQLTPHLPYEFTAVGMLERVWVYVQRQQFCDASADTWPPANEQRVVVGHVGESCDAACQRQSKSVVHEAASVCVELRCELSYMPAVNTLEALEETICENYTATTQAETVLAPCLLDDGQCLTQQNKLLYSCAAQDPTTMRLCTCRQYIDTQVALCDSCF